MNNEYEIIGYNKKYSKTRFFKNMCLYTFAIGGLPFCLTLLLYEQINNRIAFFGLLIFILIASILFSLYFANDTKYDFYIYFDSEHQKNKFLCSTDSLDDRMNIIYENNISCLSKQIEHYLCYKLSNKEMKNFFDKLKIKYSIYI